MKVFLIIFKGLSAARNCSRPESAFTLYSKFELNNNLAHKLFFS